ncbi:T6SS effector BTH_I2691 family protein [Achromobacter sp. UBA2119]|uniref:T6SS effector BTH_I2691 family protein n=1 Tax=Achromobacter sp. UBA2119 TaxID=1945911 RepID=UPI00257D9C57|nr:T6SS effector BTH_I2691 family protein [Achromobacter sp. UBA2119]
MSISATLGRTISHAAPNPTDACKACERTGLPILPLRAAYAPAPGQTCRLQPAGSNAPATVQMRLDQPRILRQGYLYVLLDEMEWQAYEVTPEGALRQFRPYQVPRDEPSPLSKDCVNKDHDVPASFINIDAGKFSTAWIAIANDPWPESVLNQYLCGNAADGTDPKKRCYKLDLKSARDDPASVGIAMTEDNLGLGSVLEYAEVNAGDFQSVHGFYSRNHRLGAMEGHIRTIVQREKLPNGVLALVLPDPIGVVQECNAQRVHLFREMQEWRAEPQRRFEFFTSQALLGIKELQAVWAKAEAEEEAKAAEENRRRHNNSIAGLKVGYPQVHIPGEAERIAKNKQAEAKERLEERYDERARATFEEAYLAAQDNWQKAVDRVGELYVREYLSRPFQLAVQYDYSATSWRSTEGFIRMLALCLAGGPTEVIKKGDEKLGATQRLWKAQLENRESHLYQALVAKDMALLNQLQTALTGNDVGKAYDTIKTVIGTAEGKTLMVAPVQEAIGQLLAAMGSASNALGQQLASQTHALVGRLHSAAFLRYSGQHVTQIVVSLKLGEYLSLLNEALQERIDKFLSHIDENFRKPAAHRIRAMVASGAIAIAVPGNHGKVVNLIIWSLERGEALQKRLSALGSAGSEGVADAIRTVSVGAETLETGAVHLVGKLSIGAEETRDIARRAMQRMRSAAISVAPAGVDLLLALGSLWFQQDSLRKNYATLLNTPGSGNAEALAAVWSSSVGAMGVGVEVVGVGVRALRPDLNVTVQIAGRTKAVTLGTRLAQYGGAIAASANALNAFQFYFAANRATSAGDDEAARFYVAAAAVSVVAVVSGVHAALVGGALLGPVGIAIVLGLAAYGVASLATKKESSPLEIWARRTLYGLPERQRRWKTPQDLDSATGELNAAVLGLAADVGINFRMERASDIEIAGEAYASHGDAASIPMGVYLDYAISLPNYSPESSCYLCAVTVYRPGEQEEAIASIGNVAGFEGPASPRPTRSRDYHPKTTKPIVYFDNDRLCLIIRGAVALHANHGIHAVKLELSYWPDKSDKLGVAKVIRMHDKMDSPENE